MRDCGKVNMVQVDNTAEECNGEYMDYKCVLVTDMLPYIGNRKNIKLSDFLLQLEEVIKGQSKVITYLKKEITRLNNKIKK